jgi:hypothetical protein
VTAFYDAPGAPTHFARFAFCKRDEVLLEALARLEKLFGARGADATPSALTPPAATA